MLFRRVPIILIANRVALCVSSRRVGPVRRRIISRQIPRRKLAFFFAGRWVFVQALFHPVFPPRDAE